MIMKGKCAMTENKNRKKLKFKIIQTDAKKCTENM